MLIIIIIWTTISFVFLTVGDFFYCLYNKLTNRHERYSIIDTFLLGLFSLLIPLSISSLFLPSNEYVLAMYFVLSVLYWTFRKTRLRLILNSIKVQFNNLSIAEKMTMVCLILAVAFNLVWSASIFDASYYHHQFISCTERYAIIPGLANLESRLGFNSNYLLLSSPFTFRFLLGYPVYFMQSLFALYILIWIYIYIIRSKYSASSIALALIFGLLYYFYINDLHDSSTDIIPSLTIFYLASKYTIEPTKLQEDSVLIFLAPIAICTFKLSVLPFTLLAFYILP